MKTIWTVLLAAVLQGAPVAVRAQFTYTTNNGAITLAGYSGSGGSVVISNFVNIIPQEAFVECDNLTNITIPSSVTNILQEAFFDCPSLTSVEFWGNAPIAHGNVTYYCPNATVYYLPGTSGWSNTFGGLRAALFPYSFTTNAGTITITGYSGAGGPVCIPAVIYGLPVTGIGTNVFSGWCNLDILAIPGSVINITANAFSGCTNLIGVYFGSNAPAVDATAFSSDGNAIVYYCAGSTGWMSPFAGLPAAAVQDQYYTCMTNGAGFTIFGYSGPGGAVAIPAVVNGVLVTTIGQSAFEGTGLTSVIILPGSVTSIASYAFENCTNLVCVTIPASVTNIGAYAFFECGSLNNVYFQGNAPSFGPYIFGGGYSGAYDPATVYYLPGTTGWSYAFAGRPTMLWNPLIQTGDGGFGVQNGQFGFNTTGTSGIPIVIEACTNLSCPVWVPVRTNTLTSGSCCFSEPLQAGSPGRFYRIRSP